MNLFLAGIYFNQDALADFEKLLMGYSQKDQQVFVLADDQTKQYCWPLLEPYFQSIQIKINLITIPHGEENKNLHQLNEIWKKLTKAGAGRDSVLINLGGGVITDLGGFAAASYKRGIQTIHFPTTLLAMADAALGGKTGIDFEGFKNQIGTFYQPTRVYILTDFLKTLPKKQWRSGLGEMIKYSFITEGNTGQFEPFTMSDDRQVMAAIEQAVRFKMEVVAEDPKENGRRKILNFGHTVGHAFESLGLSRQMDITHGEAIAAGIVAELFVSVKLKDLNEKVLTDYISYYHALFDPFILEDTDIENVMDLIVHDKKNKGGKVMMVCLDRKGNAVFDVLVEPEQLKQCLLWYSELF
jgi:3-dehydroquinate synthase